MSKNLFNPPSVPSTSTSKMSTDDKDEILQMLREIKSKVHKNSIMLKKLLKDKRVSDSAPSSTSMPSKVIKSNLNLPLQSIEDVFRTEGELKNATTRKKYVKYLSGLGGFGQKKVIKNITQHLLTDDLAKEFNWQGRGEILDCVSFSTLGAESSSEHLTSQDTEMFIPEIDQVDNGDKQSNTYSVKQSMYAVITLQEPKELTVIPTNWLNEEKTQCYWPPFKSPEKCLEAVKNRLEPARGEKAWEMLNIDFHREHGAESSSEHLTSEDTEMFIPEIDRVDNGDKQSNTYRFISPHSGQFRCSLTNLVFVMEGKGELRYTIVPWDPCLLDGLGQMQPAGPLYNIECFKGSISQLHLPHCEIMSEENKDIRKINLAHFTDCNVEMLQPLKVTDTHVITGITELSLFGLIKKIIFPASPVCAQVLLFLRPITVAQNQKILNVHLLPGNVPLSEVQSRHQEKKYIETSSICHLIPGTQYRLCCHPEECEVQPADDVFRCNFGPNYHTTFEVFLDVSIEEVRLGLLDKTEERTEVWKLRRVPLPALSQDVEFSADRRFTESEFVDKHRDKLIQRVTSAMEMADCLKSKDMITSEMYNKVHAAEPREEKMRIIFDVLESGGASVKAEFCRLLKQKEPYLVDELESGPS